MLLPSFRGVPIHFFNLSLKLLDLRNETGLIFFLQLGVLLECLSCLSELFLQLLAGMLPFTHKSLVFGDILLQIVEDLQFLVEGNQSIQFVFKLNLLLLESQLEDIFLALVKHRCGECPGHSFGGRGCGGLGRTVGPLFCGGAVLCHRDQNKI